MRDPYNNKSGLNEGPCNRVKFLKDKRKFFLEEENFFPPSFFLADVMFDRNSRLELSLKLNICLLNRPIAFSN